MKKRIAVVGAVVVRDGQVMCAQRGPGSILPYKWEFPGGKIEQGETARQALEREIVEELNCLVDVGDEVTTTTYDYDFAVVTLTTFYCTLLGGEPELTEHAQVLWSTPAALADLDWAPADVPAVLKIAQDLAA